MAKTGLLLVDLQNDVLHPDGKLSGSFPAEAGDLLDAVRKLVTWAHSRDVPVIWLRLAFRPGHIDAVWDSRSRREGALVDGEWGAEILDGLGRDVRDITVTKKRPSGFFQTELAMIVRALRVERMLVGGVSTNWAVESTVRDGHSHDLRMVVVREAVGTPFHDLHEASLKSMETVFAEVVPLAEILAES